MRGSRKRLVACIFYKCPSKELVISFFFFLNHTINFLAMLRMEDRSREQNRVEDQVLAH